MVYSIFCLLARRIHRYRAGSNLLVNERVISKLLISLLTSSMGGMILELSRRFYPAAVNEWVEITPLSLRLPRLASEFHGYRLVQISDFHIGTWLKRPRLEEAVEMVNRLRPDLVAITGDFVTFEPRRFAPDLVATLRQLTPRDGTLAVLGNHDYWTNPQIVRQVWAEAGIIDLSNTVYTLRRGNAELHIAGVDCVMEGMDRLDLVISQLPAEGAAVLLAHEPDFADISASTGRFDLQISGHSHGGQIRLPRFRPPILPRFARKYPSGLYQVGGMHLYTNRGLGTAELEIRVNCPPEITLYSLQSLDGNGPAGNNQADSF